MHPLKQCIYFRYRKNCNHPFFEVNVPLLLVVPLFDALCHSLSFVVTRCHSLSLVVHHFLSLAVTHRHLLSLVVIRCHSLSLVVPLIVIRCTTRCHSLSLVVIRCHLLSFVVTRCHSLPLVVPLAVIRCYSLSLDVPLVCLFINDRNKMRLNKKKMGLNKRKDFRSSSMRLLFPCAIVCYDAPIVLIRYYSKGDRHKHKKWGWKRNDMNRGVFRIQSNIYDETFLRKSEAATRNRSIQKGVLKNFTKFPGKHLCKSLFFNKTVGLRSATLLKKRLWHRCFPVNFVTSFFYRTPPDNCFLKLHYRYSARF